MQNISTLRCQKPKRRTPAVSGRGAAQDKAQRSRSMSTSPECHRVRGRSPAFAALTSAFEKPSTRNLSTPPPAVKKLFPKSTGPDTSKEAAISELTSSLEGPLKRTIPKSVKGIVQYNCLDFVMPIVIGLLLPYISPFWTFAKLSEPRGREDNTGGRWRRRRRARG